MTKEKRSDLNPAESKQKDSAPPLIRSTRKEQGRKNSSVEEAPLKKQFWVQIRILPIWLRVVLVLLLLTGAAMFGALVGYSSIGDGESGDVFKKETWTHILDIINGKEL
ncbi:DNA-directed RNA polymerase subunit beta [Sporosarcina sp. ANT_H38]|uniref:DNA-directed RNA polymerase subunit beta n=1 Tax=Sporosarcina sp. ANT_H38 TaxID=2597358 RepID=UPI0011F10080|nr:DNA-directed RNA polymerase subunit beta [Sporosarcina sp. ANT_H38]KAA0955634.1 DNA-directed RNA polymerase subunit beta [Sporosarcina sp. ANT_H38]